MGKPAPKWCKSERSLTLWKNKSPSFWLGLLFGGFGQCSIASLSASSSIISFLIKGVKPLIVNYFIVVLSKIEL
jgi:hypothetical protein